MSHDKLQEHSEIEREIRFAVVIYGGVSLAIYINGIVQEMLHMVRSTAKDLDPAKLTPLEKVYRRLASCVGRPGHDDSPHKHRPGKAGLRAEQRKAGTTKHLPEIPPIHTKFVVDILSGTSAGGINAIYLAKALANHMSLESLAELWITEADLEKLLNDQFVKPKFLRQSPPPSLLNSRWMYLQLLSALYKMNHTAAAPGASLVDDLDLYCTATDLRGLPIDIALTDENVKECRYRNYYHFKRRTTVDSKVLNHDFTSEMDPFLAFAARCTSSFPFAFEPMQLGDVPAIVAGKAEYRDYFVDKDKTDADAAALFGEDVAQLAGAKKFVDICRVYQSEAAQSQVNFSYRSFGDGGYLDNKPFTYAIETMKKRHATLPVDRKLIYIEPGPENLELRAKPESSESNQARPSPLENSLDALVVLPRYETIRQDIESVIEWNASISRLRRVLDHIDEEIKARIRKDSSFGFDKIKDTLCFDSYWRLRLSGTADQLGDRLAFAMNVEPATAEGQALRCIVGSWRERKFGLVKNHHEPRFEALQQRFLDLFDFDFCQRALRFLRIHLQKDEKNNQAHLHTLAKITAEFLILSDQVPSLDLSEWNEEPDAYTCWKQYLKFIVDPKAAARALGVAIPGESTERTSDSLSAVPDLEGMLSTTDAGRDSRVAWLLDHKESVSILRFPAKGANTPPRCVPFSKIVDYVAQKIIAEYSGKRLTYSPDLQPPFTERDDKIETSLQALFTRMKPLFDALKNENQNHWDYFRMQDVQAYPIIFNTTLGEFEAVDIFRISPQDTRPIENTAPRGRSLDNMPLKGASLGAFGAFLEQWWRLNDMLRGRLDGAERLITAVLPDSDQTTLNIREELIQAAQEAIALEWQEFQQKINPPLPKSYLGEILQDSLARRKQRSSIGREAQS